MLSLRTAARSAALLALLALPAAAAPDVSGGFELIGEDAVGRYRGRATLAQDAQGRVEGTLTLEYVRWSWTARAYVSTGRFGAARLEGRVEGQHLRGVRRTNPGLAGSLGLAGPHDRAVRYRIYERAGRITAIRAAMPGGWEQLHRHAPATDARTRDLLALRAELERAASGMLWLSESDHPFTWVAFDGAADRVRSVADFKALLGVEAARPAEERTLLQTLGWRLEHQPGESPEEAAEVDRYRALRGLLEGRLTEVRVYRVGDPDTTAFGDLLGAIDVFIVGRNAHGDLVGLRTVSVET